MAWTQKTKSSPSGSEKRAAGGNSSPTRARNNRQKAVRATAAKAVRDNNAGDNAAKRKASESLKASQAKIAKAKADREAQALKTKQAKDKSDAKAKADKQAKDKAAYDKAQAAKAQAKAVAAAKVKRDNQAKIAKAEKAQAAKAKQAKDKADAKAVADKRAKDKTEYDKGIELAAKKAKVKRENAAKKLKADALKAAAEGDVPVGAVWSGSPQETNVDPLERLERSDGMGMQNQGDAYYPTGYAESLEDNAPDSLLGYGRALLNPMSSIITTAGQTMLNQTQYGMNKEAADLYKDLIKDPANAGMSVKELVQMARQPQMDKQLPNAFINDETGSTATESQLNAIRPFIKDLSMSDTQWNSLPIEMKRHLASGTKVDSSSGVVTGGGGGNGGGGMLTGAPVAPTAPTAPTLGQLTTGDYTPTERPSWAPNPTFMGQPVQQQSFAPQWNQQPQQTPSFAPQWNQQQQVPSFAPRPRSMLGAPMQLRAPPSRFLRR
jgi:hypothetical protein